MQEQLEIAIRHWQEADRLAQGNTDLMLSKNYSPENGGIANERMKALSGAQKGLIEVVSSMDAEEIPAPLADYLATRPFFGKSSACNECWPKADDERRHPDCEEKIRQFFSAVEAMRSL